jgi:DNA-binding IclR family transcriptional regulator
MSNDDSPPSILAKAFSLLRAFTPDRQVMSLSEIGRASGLPKSTVHRLLARLIELGAIEHHRSGYRIGVLMTQLGAITPAMGMREVAAPYLTSLHHRTGMTVHLGVLREFDVVILDKQSRRNPPSSWSGFGARLPANCCALGKVLLAHEDLDDLAMFLPRSLPALTSASITDAETLVAQLREIQEVGVARDAQEARSGLASLAAPLVVMGSTVGAISLTYPISAAPMLSTAEMMLRDTATRISGDVWSALTDGMVHLFPREIDAPVEPSFTRRFPAEAAREAVQRNR